MEVTSNSNWEWFRRRIPNGLAGWDKARRGYVVIGLGRSGTTAMYAAIKRGLPRSVDLYFEPRDFPAVRRTHESNALLAKILIQRLELDRAEWLRETFARGVILVRDPRDNLISRLLYKVRDMEIIHDPSTLSIWLDALRQKEEDPESVGVIELYQLFEELSGFEWLDVFPRYHDRAIGLWERLSDTFVLQRYEDFVEGDTADVSRYLGIDVSPDVEVDADVRRVSRTRGHGAWKDWFLDSDLEYVRARCGEFMRGFGYADDWRTNDVRTIDRETTTAYVERIVAMRLSGTG